MRLKQTFALLDATRTGMPADDDILTQPDARQRLLMAAEVVFANKGFEAASVREICSEAKANIAAINYHFGSKERLYIEAVKNAHSCSTRTGPPPSWPAGTSPATKLRDFIRMVATQMTEPARPTALQLMMREMSHPSEATREVVREYIRPMAELLRGILGEMFPTAEPHRLLMVGFSVIGQCLYYRQNRPVSEIIFSVAEVERLSTELIVDHITRFTLAALGHGPAVTAEHLAAPLPGGDL